MVSNLKPINIKDVKSVENWYDRFSLYALTNKDINEDNETAYYLTLAGEEAYLLLKDLAFPKEISKLKAKELHLLLLKHIKPTQFEVTERATFHKIVREPEERMKDFLLRIQQQASNCQFGDQLESQMRDRIVAGVNDEEVERKLLIRKELTFKNASQILIDSDSISAVIKSTAPVLAVNNQSNSKFNRDNRKFNNSDGNQSNKFYNSNQKKYNNNYNSLNSSPHGKCYSCGGPHFTNSCRFRNAKCNKCQS